MWATWRLTDDMLFAKKLHPGLVCSCNNCDWHYPPEFAARDGITVRCQAWENDVFVDSLCRRWNLDNDICLIYPPPWCEKRPKRRIT